MYQEIQVFLGDTGAVGSRATVTTHRILREPLVEVFVCHKSNPVMGASWINEKTGIAPKERLAMKLTSAAQAAANLMMAGSIGHQ